MNHLRVVMFKILNFFMPIPHYIIVFWHAWHSLAGHHIAVVAITAAALMKSCFHPSKLCFVGLTMTYKHTRNIEQMRLLSLSNLIYFDLLINIKPLSEEGEHSTAHCCPQQYI